MALQNELNIDKSEYKAVFKVFDKDNNDEISIKHVYEVIEKFESRDKDGGKQNTGDASHHPNDKSYNSAKPVPSSSKSPTKKTGANTGPSSNLIQLKPTDNTKPKEEGSS